MSGQPGGGAGGGGGCLDFEDSQALPFFLACHERAFDYLGGCAGGHPVRLSAKVREKAARRIGVTVINGYAGEEVASWSSRAGWRSAPLAGSGSRRARLIRLDRTLGRSVMTQYSHPSSSRYRWW